MRTNGHPHDSLPPIPRPIVYLGLPLINPSYNTTLMTSFVHKLQKQTLLHSARSLSILGKTTIAISLIISMCQYLFHVILIPNPVVDKVRLVVSQFLNKGVFPRIKWSVLTLSKQYGGFSVLDPHIQQAALYFHWIKPYYQTPRIEVQRCLASYEFISSTHSIQHIMLFCSYFKKVDDVFPCGFSTIVLSYLMPLILFLETIPIWVLLIHLACPYRFRLSLLI